MSRFAWLMGLYGENFLRLSRMFQPQSLSAGTYVSSVPGGLDLLVVVDGGPGGTAEGIVAGAREAGLGEDRIRVVADADEAIARVREAARDGDVVLVKASRGVALERVVDGLAAGTGEGTAG